MTTIQISEELKQELTSRKIYEKETYEEIIWNLVEDTKELSQETKREIKEAREQYARGEYYTLEEIEEEFGL